MPGQEAIEAVELAVPLGLPAAPTLAQGCHASVEMLEDEALHRPARVRADEVVAQGPAVPAVPAAQSALVVIEEGVCHTLSITTILFLDRLIRILFLVLGMWIHGGWRREKLRTLFRVEQNAERHSSLITPGAGCMPLGDVHLVVSPLHLIQDPIL